MRFHRWFMTGVGLVALAWTSTSMAIDLSSYFSQFDAAYTFDNAANRLEDASGNGNDLVVGAGGPTYGAPLASTNGFAPAGVFTDSAAFNANGPRLDTPAGLYTGGDFTISMAARSGTGSNLNFGSVLTSNRFQMHQDGQPGAGRLDVRNVGTGDFAGTDAFTFEDWTLVTLRYDSATGLVEQFIQTNTDTLDASPESFNVGANWTTISTFGLGGDGLTGIGGFDAFGGQSQIDFVVFENRALSDTELNYLSNVFANNVPEPASVAIWSILGLGLAGFGFYRVRGKK